MISLRGLVLATLVGLPLVTYLVAGGYALWYSGTSRWVWWLVAGCGLAAWLIARVWKPSTPWRGGRADLPEPLHWTPRDRAAAAVVRRYQQAVTAHTMKELTDPAFYGRQLRSLAVELGRIYHPRTTDPVAHLTVLEVLAASRLVADDLERWMLTSVPGSRLLTIRQWRRLPSAPRWVQRVSDARWLAAVLINPLNITRYAAARWTWGAVGQQLQEELVAVVYLRFLRQAGFYLIEMNSGRLKGGADAYRQAFATRTSTVALELSPPESSAAEATITIALVGQVGAGKSSLVNLLVADAGAAVDVLPETRTVERYQSFLGDPVVTLSFLDTPGYGERGASSAERQDIERALTEADLVLLVIDAHAPARAPDVNVLGDIDRRARSQPGLRPPPVIAVLTHVDLLPPPLVWTPPYAWRHPTDAKGRAVKSAVDHVRQLFGPAVARVVPVCADLTEDRTWGVADELLPAIIEFLDEAQAVALLRSYEARLTAERWRTLLGQLARVGQGLVRVWIEERLATTNVDEPPTTSRTG